MQNGETASKAAAALSASEGSSAPEYYQVWNQALFDLLPADCRNVLEVGCAAGRLGEAVKKRNPSAYYVGIEVVPAAARVAKQRLDEVYAENVEGFDWTRLAGRSFDCVVFGDVLEHLLDPKGILLEAAKLLAPGGSVVCCLPNVGHWSIIAGLIEGKWDYADSGLLDRTHLRFFTIKTFREMLESCGFKVVQEDRLRAGAQLPQEIAPFLQKLGVDVQEFLDRVTTFQFLMRAEIVQMLQAVQNTQQVAKVEPRAESPRPQALPASSSSWHPAGAVPKATVAIIIPVFNKMELTRDCLASIAKHYAAGVAPDVLVFDNASSDGTQDYLADAQQKYEWLKTVRSPTNLGFARACNKGAELADADILVFLNNDTIVLPNWLERMLDRIDDPGVGMVGSKLLYPDGRIQHAGVVFNMEATPAHIHHLAGHGDAAVNRMMEYPAVTGACFMIRRALFLEVGKMDTDYPMYYEDIDLCFKVRQKGLKIIYQPASVVIHLEGRSSANLESILAHNQASKAIFYRKWKDFMLKELAVDPKFYEAGKDYRPA